MGIISEFALLNGSGDSGGGGDAAGMAPRSRDSVSSSSMRSGAISLARASIVGFVAGVVVVKGHTCGEEDVADPGIGTNVTFL
jgi:hypothetical protein